MCARMFTPKARSHSAGVARSIPTATPALAQNRSTSPKALSAAPINASACPGSATSHWKGSAPSPICSATASAPSPSRSATTTPLAPSAANRSAIARPIPDAPPVTTATLSGSSMRLRRRVLDCRLGLRLTRARLGLRRRVELELPGGRGLRLASPGLRLGRDLHDLHRLRLGLARPRLGDLDDLHLG